MSNSPRRKAIKRRQLAAKQFARLSPIPLARPDPWHFMSPELERAIIHEYERALLGISFSTTDNGDGTYTHTMRMDE